LEGIIDVKKEDGAYRVKAVNGEASIPTVLKAVWDAGITVSSVTLHQPSLDQAFLEYTGKSLRDAESAGGFDKMATARANRRRR
jgi:ABC-2 type transport system ATP-binding protein